MDTASCGVEMFSIQLNPGDRGAGKKSEEATGTCDGRGRKARNEEVRKLYQGRRQICEAERDLAKEERKRWEKPKQSLLEKPVPRPKKPDDGEADSDEEDEDEDLMRIDLVLSPVT
ncbi:hypothetical protein BYT27DRAFT_7252888 [Phlegmacium glaucopus]|nr:hypothetical protein BYT27DRAFT_7252888 [Phlegmacium glaucopus]